MRALPTTATRISRRRGALLAFAVVSLISISASQIATTATLRITSEIDSHWRGAYDLLVRPRGSHLGLEQTAGLVEPNFISLAGAGGITQRDVDAIRAIPGVEVAAPIGWVGLLSTGTTAPSVTIDSSLFPGSPVLYSVTVTVTTSDGLSERLVSKSSFRLLLGATAGAHGSPLAVSDSGDVLLGKDADGHVLASVSTGRSLPAIQSPLVAVDPQAERALLGTSGAFLAPLNAVGHADSLTVESADPGMVLPDYDQGSLLAALQQQGGKVLGRPVFPVLVSSRAYSPLKVAIDVARIGRPISAPLDTSMSSVDLLDKALALAGATSTPAGSNAFDWSTSIRPLRMNPIGVAWPGGSLTENPAVYIGASSVTAALTARPQYVAVSPPPAAAAHPSWRLTPLGTVPAGGPGASQWTDPGFKGTTTLGSDQSYRSLTPITMPLAQSVAGQGLGDVPFVLAPVGTYDLTTLQLPSDPLSYVPLGAYDPPNTQLVADAAGSHVTPVEMTPTLDPAGLLPVPPAGFVDIHAAELLRGPAPIDAVRVRVAGITGYSPEALSKVERVAGAIASLGLDVDVVAASSPQTVNLYVPGYHVEQSPIADLGWVQQHWTTLGATPRVERALSETNLVLLIMAALTAAMIVFGAEVVSLLGRSREAALLGAIGWRRRQIVVWQASESSVAGLAVITLGVVTWGALAPHEAVGLVVPFVVTAFYVLGGIVGSALATRPAHARGRSVALRLPHQVGGLRTYALRSWARRPAIAAVIVLGVAVAASVVAPAATLVVSLALRAGPTALAEALSTRLSGYQWVLTTLIAGGALATAAVAFRVDIGRRRPELRVLETVGMSPGRIRRMLVWSALEIAIPAALVATAIAGVIAGPLTGGESPLAPVLVATAFVAVGACLAMGWTVPLGGFAREGRNARS